MSSGTYRFDRFQLDIDNRLLQRDGEVLSVSSRYLDALSLLVRERGSLVSKERFHEEVWRGVPVTDEALTQAIRTLRKTLGDDPASPRFIETVPKHGYRFIAPLADTESSAATRVDARTGGAPRSPRWSGIARLGHAGTFGGGVAGAVGGTIYGSIAASQNGTNTGSISTLLVFVVLTAAIGLLGGAGVAFGIATARIHPQQRWYWSAFGGATGGFLIGAFTKLLGIDAFNLLFGRAPASFTGAFEGALLGGAVGLAAGLAGLPTTPKPLRSSLPAACLSGGLAGLFIPLLGGRMLGGSLDLLAHTFPESRIQMTQLGALLGESSFGPVSQAITGCLEGMLFGSCVVGAMVLSSRGGSTQAKPLRKLP